MTPTPEQCKVGLGHVRYEIEQLVKIVAQYHDVTQSVVSFADDAQLENLLLHARVLLTFFQRDKRFNKPKAKPPEEDDDVLAKDFGFGERRVGVTDSNQTRLNKDLAHLTYSRAGIKWVIDDISRPLFERCKEFAMHVLSPSGPSYLDAKSREEWDKLHTKLATYVTSSPSGAEGATGSTG